MTPATLRECESVTRVIARWGSVVAAVVFGIGFVTDSELSYKIVAGQADQIILVLLVFAGYLLAWKKEYEVIGSVVAIVAAAVLYAWCLFYKGISPSLFILAIAAPALLHLLAVAFHRRAVLMRKGWKSNHSPG